MAAYTAVDNPELYFQIKTWTGDGQASLALTLPGDEDMQPDLVWIKSRSEAESHPVFDADNLKLYFAKNGTWQNSGDPTSGATGTGAAFTVDAGKTWLPAMSNYNSSDIECNFGG